MTTVTELFGLTHPEAEETVLAGMLADPDLAIRLAEAVEAADFADPRFAYVCEAVQRVLMGIEPVDAHNVATVAQSIATERKDNIAGQLSESYVKALQGDPRRAMAYAHQLKRLSWLRRAGGFAHWLVGELSSDPEPTELFAEAQERWQHIAPQSQSDKFVYGWDTVPMHEREIRERIAETERNERMVYDWPWQSWQRRIRPLRAGMVGLIAAADGIGKTTYLEMIAEHWAAHGMHVVYVHLEDALDYKLDRRLARWAGVPIEAIEDGSLNAVQQRDADDMQHVLAGKLQTLHYYHAAGESAHSILRELEARRSEGVCDAVVLDYIDKMAPTRAQVQTYGTNTWERQAADMEALKTFAERNSLPLLTATQGNKTMQDSGTRTRQSIQGSGQKSQKSQLVVLLTREIVGEDGLADQRGNMVAEPGEYSPLIDVRIDKQNRGKTGQFQQFLLGSRFAVRDIER